MHSLFALKLIKCSNNLATDSPGFPKAFLFCLLCLMYDKRRRDDPELGEGQ